MSSERQEPDRHRTVEILSLLDSEARLDILLSLNEAVTPTRTAPLPFNDLWDAVDIDDSGRFNYHLGELRGTFIEKTDEGYRLTYPGKLITQLIKSGSFSGEETSAPLGTDIDCLHCEDTVSTTYEEQIVSVECLGCETFYTKLHVPPRCLSERSGDHLFRAAIQYAIREVSSLVHGVCPNCGGRASHETVSAAERRAEAEAPTLYYTCSVCDYWMRTGFGLPMVLHPAVVAFYYDHGIDLLSGADQHFLEFVLAEQSPISVDPDGTATLTKRLDDEELHLTVDEHVDVLRCERRSAVQ